MADVWKNALRSLWRKRLRAALTMGGIVVGVALVAVVSVIGDAGKEAIGAELANMGLNGLSVTATGDAMLDETALAAVKALPQVTSAVPLMLQSGSVISGEESETVLVCGITDGETQAIGLTLCSGRLFTAGDIGACAQVCVVDATLAQRLYQRSNIVGKTLTFTVGGVTESFTVIGVTQTGSMLLQNVTQWVPGMVYVPYTTMQELTGRSNFDQLAVQLEDAQSGTDGEEICATLARIGGSDGYAAQDLGAQREQLASLMDIVTLVLTAIGSVSLLVSGLSIMTIMTVSVGERTREIGIKKAIGATNGRIRREFLAEAALLSLGGGLIGTALGGGAAWWGLSLFGMTAVLPLTTALRLIGFSLAIGTAFGVYPAAKAARLRPVEALRAD